MFVSVLEDHVEAYLATHSKWKGQVLLNKIDIGDVETRVTVVIVEKIAARSPCITDTYTGEIGDPEFVPKLESFLNDCICGVQSQELTNAKA